MQNPTAKKGDNIIIVESAKRNNNNNNSNKNKNENRIKKEIEETTVDLVSAILKQDKTYVLPRAIPTIVAPHNINFSKPFIPDVDPASGNVKTAVVFRPDPDLFMLYTSQGAVTTSNWQITQEVDFSFTPSSNIISLDPDILAPNVVRAFKTNSGLQGKHFSSQDNRLKDGITGYQGEWTIPAADLAMKIYNPLPTDITIAAVAGHVNGSGAAVLDYETVGTVCTAKSITSIPLLHLAAGFIAWQNALVDPANAGMWLGFQCAGLETTVTSGFQASIDLVGVTRSASVVWNTRSIWDFIDPGSAANSRAQFNSASRFVVSGFTVLVQNTTVMLNKGGNIYAARLPGDYRLDGTVDNIISTITSQKHHILHSADLALGANLPWTPEKVQDWLFQQHPDQDPYNGNPLNKPFIAMAFDFTGITPGTTPTLNFQGGFSMEYLTTDASNTFVRSPCNPELFELLAAELSIQEVFSENPQHLSQIKDVIKKVITSDGFKKFAYTAINAGVKAAPFVLSLLV